jgi:hypothetical protein
MAETYGFEDPQDRLIIIRKFYDQSQADLYSARLREAGIEHFLTNNHMNTMLHMATSEIGIQIRSQDADEVRSLFESLDEMNSENLDQSFHDADLDDIYYEKSLHESRNGGVSWIVTLVVLIIIIMLLFISYL